MSKYLPTAKRAAIEAAPLFRRYFGKPKHVFTKDNNPQDFVTEVDQKIEKIIRACITKKFPTHKIIGEEGGMDIIGKGDVVWIIDPIDGTTNYIQGLPWCCISVGIWDSTGPLEGLIYNPITDVWYTAVRNHGAKRNNKTIRASAKSNTSRGYGGIGWGKNPRTVKHIFLQLAEKNKLRSLGSVALELCLLAEGIYDFHLQASIKVWDFAAAALIAQEAGALVTNAQGKKLSLTSTSLFASKKHLYHSLHRVIRRQLA